MFLTFLCDRASNATRKNDKNHSNHTKTALFNLPLRKFSFLQFKKIRKTTITTITTTKKSILLIFLLSRFLLAQTSHTEAAILGPVNSQIKRKYLEALLPTSQPTPPPLTQLHTHPYTTQNTQTLTLIKHLHFEGVFCKKKKDLTHTHITSGVAPHYIGELGSFFFFCSLYYILYTHMRSGNTNTHIGSVL